MLPRTYYPIIQEHLAHYQQMLFLAGPRQVGKTTLLRYAQEKRERFRYCNWDNWTDREKILRGHAYLLSDLDLDVVSLQKPVVALDEIHKYGQWKTFLKGLYDAHKEDLSILVTGSSKLDLYRRRGDSLMGRYFLYRVHPFSIGELVRPAPGIGFLDAPTKVSAAQLEGLLLFGGFPEPFLAQERRFYNRWQARREQQMIFEDIRELSQIHALTQLQLLADLLKHQAGAPIKYSRLANKVKVSQPTIQAWMSVLENFYYCFTVRPWTENVARSLLKAPKVYLWDWSRVPDRGAQAENLVASHLLKSIHYWTDMGRGEYGLYFVRTKDKKEVDFMVTENDKPWLLVEVKASPRASLNPHLTHFKETLNIPYAFQVALDMPYMDVDCRSLKRPQIMPLVTFLSQLV